LHPFGVSVELKKIPLTDLRAAFRAELVARIEFVSALGTEFRIRKFRAAVCAEFITRIIIVPALGAGETADSLILYFFLACIVLFIYAPRTAYTQTLLGIPADFPADPLPAFRALFEIALRFLDRFLVRLVVRLLPLRVTNRLADIADRVEYTAGDVADLVEDTRRDTVAPGFEFRFEPPVAVVAEKLELKTVLGRVILFFVREMYRLRHYAFPPAEINRAPAMWVDRVSRADIIDENHPVQKTKIAGSETCDTAGSDACVTVLFICISN